MTPNERGFVSIVSVVLGVLVAKRWLRQKAIGNVVVGPVTVTPTVLDQEDLRQGIVSEHQREALALLHVDLDTMTPTHHPNQAEDAQVVQTIQELLVEGRTGDGQFLEDLLDEARELPPS